ncbi:peptide chain release factor N(5)-glutamine methyltransferase [Hymenobacter cellulosilyticus]|uniref:peptide chain release factor N(5)-glutamine methyltransferase n=1 Tax=Hymenobacter cellulosilyticus TaxID=2932248 RepID=A0A8T9Q912_9BACT|nr:peptide chain release factor N(5)-glutamine methyltransferase [Hymenobacter cellulosilyticus]UOQ73472.1 peptide chain release factor N(5)-glutamine methyltransferase [Hymenobacter cellulosilyticus]
MFTIRQLTTTLAAALHAVYPEPEAQSIAGLVIEHLLHLSPLQRRMQAAQEVPTDVETQVAPLQARLLLHEPVQYVLGVAYFAGLELEVTPATLIPRPETEELVALIIAEHPGKADLTIVDIGTGSGCIPIALEQTLRPKRVVGVDISAAALEVARRNAARYGSPVEFVLADILTQEPDEILPGSVAVLVSNPPYVLENERPLMRRNVLDFEPATALFVPNHDPLLFYRRIGELGRRWLQPGGGLYFEINEQYAAELLKLLRAQGYTTVEPRQDIFGKDRMVRATQPG